MADDDAILAALELRAPGANQYWWCHLTDIVLTAALLAGSADPIQKLMDGFSAKARGTEIKSVSP